MYAVAGEETSMAEMHWFGSGDLARVLGVDLWRIKNFSQGAAYRLPALQTIGSGTRRMRIYRTVDVFRFAVANQLEQSGHDPESIGAALDAIPAKHLDSWTDFAPDNAKDALVLCWLDSKWKVIKSKEARAAIADALEQSQPVVALNLYTLFSDVTKRVAQLQKEK